MEVLQTLRAPFRRFFRINDLAESFENPRPFALRRVRRIRGVLWGQGQKRDSHENRPLYFRFQLIDFAAESIAS